MAKTWPPFDFRAAREQTVDAKAQALVDVVDSHTEREPTRVVIGGGPDLGQGPMDRRAVRMHMEYSGFRAFVMDPPRGTQELVGALLMPPCSRDAFAGALFFNNVGGLRMCVHASIGIARTLAYLGAWPGSLEAPVGIDTVAGRVNLRLHDGPEASVENVISYRTRSAVGVETSRGQVVGDVAFGGNWFFIVRGADTTLELSLELDRVDELTALSWEIRRGLTAQGITGPGGEEIDHIQLVGNSVGSAADARNFVLCPGGAYDRSPCGTGTSALMACLAADGELGEGDVWRQQSITGSTFAGQVRHVEGGVIPTVRGRAFVTGRGQLVRESGDSSTPR